MELFENRSAGVVFGCFGYSTGESILNSLEPFCLGDICVQKNRKAAV